MALVVTTLERARDLKQTPVVIRGAAQGAGGDQQMMTELLPTRHDRHPRDGPGGAAALRAWRAWGRRTSRPRCIYDHFTPFVLPQLEEFGFCGRGEAKDFIRDGHIERGGRLPVNTHGGQIGEAYIHGLNGVAEGVRQVRGTAVNQAPGVEHVLVTAGTGVPTSGVILGVDR